MYMFRPNTHRVIIKPVPIEELKSSGIIFPGQLKAGENLLYGKIHHPGESQFKKDQGVFYSEYSAATLVDARGLMDGTKSLADLKNDNFVVVAEDDIMAFYDTE